MPQTPPPVRDEDFPEPPRLRRLRRMVSALIAVLIGAVLIVVASLVIKIGELGVGGGAAAPVPVSAERISLPAGEEIVAIGDGPGGILVITRDGQGREWLRGFDRNSGRLLSETAIERDY